MENMSIPERAEIVVLGGGIVGCSVAYHLTLLGRRDVVVLEQNELGSGTTWHAAGMVGRLRTSNSLTEINRYSAELYSTLEEVTGHSIGWKQVGSLIVGQTEDRMVQLRRTVAMARYFGIEAGMISASEAKEKWPV
ncbi:MAG: FAD-binding oxidoreductase, partial [Verrucomicrobia bacterium]|nr:FAD-binding oxidoreductase [Verrucomicrobiota bacterium]